MAMNRRSRDELNELIDYWDRIISHTSEKRTALTSGLIPVREYVSYSGIEAFCRWPEIYDQLDEAMGAAELGAHLRGPGTHTTNAHPFALAVIPLGGWRARQELGNYGVMPPLNVDGLEDRLHTILDFWVRFAEPWRADGFRQCWDAADTLRTCDPDMIETIHEAAWPIETDEDNTEARRFVAGLQQYLFLLYLDTRMGTGDSGPYALPNGRTMIVREFSGLAESWIPWSDVGAEVPYKDLLVGLVFRPGVHNRVNDLSSTFSIPADNMEFLEAVSLFEPGPNGTLRALDRDEIPAISAAVKKAQTAAYRRFAGWSFEEKVKAGAHVYFRGILWPLTDAAGIDDQIDWEIPGEEASPAWPIFSGGLPEDSNPIAYPILPRLD